jgi:transposase InsO family protein
VDHGRRRVLAFNVTANPTVEWVSQQLQDAFDAPTDRFLIYDNDAIFSSTITKVIDDLGLRPQRTAFQSPWQNGTAERFVGTVRRELLDHVVVLNENHLRHLLRDYVEYYNAERVHTSMGDAPQVESSNQSPGARRVSLACRELAVFTVDTRGARLRDQADEL